MSTARIPFQVTDWEQIPATEHPGETGLAYWRTLQFGSLRVRLIEYSPGYKANHWCQKGHLLFVMEGELVTELSDGRSFQMTAGMSYEVSDGLSSHRSFTKHGAKLIVVDGSFLAKEAEAPGSLPEQFDYPSPH
jgi:hypothetical protein